MPLRFLTDQGYNLGMIRDAPPLQIPPGGVYDSSNMLSDYPGILRQRNATTALVSGSQTASPTSLGFAVSQDATTIEELFGVNGKTGDVISINKSTGAFTTITSAAAIGTVGRPARHFGWVSFPVATAAGRSSIAMAGQTSSTTFASTTAVTIVAGAQQITLAGPDTTTNIKVGATVIAGSGSPANTYYGRVVSVDSSTKLTVFPTPSIGFTTDATLFVTGPVVTTSGGSCVTSFQNRLLYANTVDLGSTGRTLITDRRVYYSILPTETFTTPAGITYSGVPFVAPFTWPVLNYFPIPGDDPIVAMEPISDGELLILTRTSVVIFQGNLVTELSTTSPTITFDIYPLGVTEGCASDHSVQRTPVGIMWAGAEGVFAYWPPLRKSPAKTGIRNLCEGKILNYWLKQSGASDFAIHGSFYARNHYVISGFANGATFSLAVNLGNNQWTRLAGAGTDVFGGVRRPTNPAQTFVSRWWDQTGSAPSMTNGQTLRVETMFDADVAGATRLDADGSAVAFSVTSRPIGGDFETQKMFQRMTARYQAEMDTAAVSVVAQSRVDSGDVNAGASRAIGTLSATVARTITAATNASPIAITTSAVHGLQTDDFVNIDAVGGNTNANGRYRITVTGTTTFTLNGTTGNANYTSGGNAQKFPESDFSLAGVNKGQAATVTIASTSTVKRFELHGVVLGVLDGQPVMST